MLLYWNDKNSVNREVRRFQSLEPSKDCSCSSVASQRASRTLGQRLLGGNESCLCSPWVRVSGEEGGAHLFPLAAAASAEGKQVWVKEPPHQAALPP